MLRTTIILVVLLGMLACKSPSGSSDGCPDDLATVEGTTCGGATAVCGLDDCVPCEGCATLRCIAGVWRRAESLKTPGCQAGTGGADTVAGDAIGYACDSIGYLDGHHPCGSSTPTEPEPQMPVRCLDNTTDLGGHACATEGETCGLERCADPCARCGFVECHRGAWTWSQAMPSPTCFPAGLEVGTDASCAQLGCRWSYACGSMPDDDYACGYCSCSEGDRYCGGVEEDDQGGGRAAVFLCNGTCCEPTPCDTCDQTAEPPGIPRCVGGLCAFVP